MFQIPSFSRQLNYFCHVSDVFSKQEVEKIIDLEDLNRFHQGAVGGPDQLVANVSPQGEINISTRDSDVMWISPHDGSHNRPDSLWLFFKFSDLTSKVNQDHFLYDIDHVGDFQYTVYRENQHYDWHLDVFNVWSKFERKISATILLSDPHEYEGGEFEIVLNGNASQPLLMKPNAGDVIFFASWMPHRVRPVTKGIRKSLVAWVLGKRNG